MSVQVPHFSNSFKNGYASDKFFNSIIEALNGKFPKDPVQAKKLKILLPSFLYSNDNLYFEENICVPRQNIREILRRAHDSPLGGHFRFAKTLSRLEKFHWLKEFSDVKQYCDGCLTCQQSKDSPQNHSARHNHWNCHVDGGVPLGLTLLYIFQFPDKDMTPSRPM